MIAMLVRFFLASAVLTVIPGPNTLLVLRNSLRGRAAAIATGLGTGAGALTWGLAAAIGLSVVLQRSQGLYSAVKLAGAAYLVVLGVRAIWGARGRPDAATARVFDESTHPPMGRLAAFGTGFVSDVFNPKTGLFYVAIVPQIIPSGVSVFWGTLLFSAVDATTTACWLAVLAWFAGRFIGWLGRPRVIHTTERVTGMFLVGIGVRAALEQS